MTGEGIGAGAAAAAFFPRLGRWPPRIALALIIAAAGLLLNAHFAKYLPPTYGDAPRYLSIAWDLAATGRFTDGRAVPGSPAERPPGMFNVPAYPWLVSVLARLDPRLAATARCLAEALPDRVSFCPTALGILVPLQFAFAALTLLLLWLSALAVAQSEAVAWTALILTAFGCYEYAGFAVLAITESLATLLFAALSLCLFYALRRGSLAAAAGGGLLLAAAALTRPAFLYLGYAIAAVSAAGTVALLWPRLRSRLSTGVTIGAILSAACAVALAPWFLRNGLALGSFALSRGYAGVIFAQRVAYDAMTPQEFLAAWIFWLPDFGHSLAQQLFPPDFYLRLGWDESPGTYYSIANDIIAPAAATAAGSADAEPGYILRTMVLPHPVKFAAVTLVLMWRGLWFGKYFSLVTFPMFAGVLAAQLRRRAFDLALFAAPALFMLVFQAAVSVDTPRYNVGLIPAFSIAAAVCLVAATRRGRARRHRADPATLGR